MITPVARFHASGVVPSMRECLKRCRIQGEIDSQQWFIMLSLTESGPGDLFGCISEQTFFSLEGVIRLLMMVS